MSGGRTRLAMVFLACCVVLAGWIAPSQDANAAHGWARYTGRVWVQWHTRVQQPIPHGDSVSSEYLRKLARYQHAQARAIERAISAHKAWVTAQHSVTHVTPSQGSTHDESQSHEYHGSLHALVCSYNWSCAVATCIVTRESQWNPRAYNPSSGAAGLWQWMPGWYRGHFDPFNPVAATAFAWHRYNQSGWSDWHSDKHPCY